MTGREEADAVSAEIRARLADRGRTVRWLAAQRGMPASTLDRRLRPGGRLLTTDILWIAEALDTEASEIIAAAAS